MKNTKFEIFAGYHENIIACKNELTDYFSSWQNYGTFSQEQVQDIFCKSEDNNFVFTQQAYELLKEQLALDEGEITIFNY